MKSMTTHCFGIRLALVLLLAGGSAARANDRTWNGGGGDDAWTTSGNWGGTAPVADDNLFFDGSTRLTPDNDFAADTAFGNITFNAGADAFNLGGNRITLDGNVASLADADQEIALDMILEATRTFGVNAAGDLTVSGNLTGDGGLTKTGGGTLVLSGENTYEGVTTLSGGMTRVDSIDAMRLLTGKVDVQSGATLNHNTDHIENSSLQIEIAGAGVNGSGVIRTDQTGGATITGVTLTMVGDATIYSPTTGSSQFTPVRNGAANFNGHTLTKTGSGILTFRSSTLSSIGDIVVSDGMLRLEQGSVNYSGTPTVTVTNNASIDYYRISGPHPSHHILNNGNILIYRNTTTFNGDLDLTGENVFQLRNQTPRINWNGQITGSGEIWIKHGGSSVTGTVVLANSNNDYAGNTRLGELSILRLGTSEVIPHGPGKGDLRIDPHSSFGGILDLNGFDETINGLTGATGVSPGRVLNDAEATTSTLTVGGNDASSTYQGLIVDNSGTGGAVALAKTGDGVFTLTGANTYSGGTVIDDGTLRAENTTGSATGSGTVTVNTGGTLGGTGTVGGDVVADGGTVAPGASTGILTLGGGLTLQNNAVLAVTLDGTTAGTEHDQVAVTDGDVTLDGSASLAITLGYAPAVGETFTILSNTAGNPVGGQFAGDSGATATFEGDVYVFSVDYTGGAGDDIVLQVVPTGTLILVR